ncbi:MAG: hypothetical protein ABI234_10535 [Ktedonobacteraceae bacterium]
MTDTDIIESLYHKLEATSGRRMYGVLGHSYQALTRFAKQLQRVNMPDGHPFPAPLSVTRGILAAIPDNEFHELVKDEARRPEPTRAHIKQAFERFLRDRFAASEGLVVLEHLELLYAYNIDLGLFRGLATDSHSLFLLVPGKRESGYTRLFPADQTGRTYVLPAQLIVENHLWELQD